MGTLRMICTDFGCRDDTLLGMISYPPVRGYVRFEALEITKLLLQSKNKVFKNYLDLNCESQHVFAIALFVLLLNRAIQNHILSLTNSQVSLYYLVFRKQNPSNVAIPDLLIVSRPRRGRQSCTCRICFCFVWR